VARVAAAEDGGADVHVRREGPSLRSLDADAVSAPVCQSCGQIVRWIKTVDGAQMPLDPGPSPVGNVYVTAAGRARVLTREETDRGRAAGALLYRSHHASCPAAERHRVGRNQMALEL
jgi:hypothetical protein